MERAIPEGKLTRTEKQKKQYLYTLKLAEALKDWKKSKKENKDEMEKICKKKWRKYENLIKLYSKNVIECISWIPPTRKYDWRDY